MSDPTNLPKPKTRQQVADMLGISTKTLTRFLEKENIILEPRILIKPKLVVYITQRYLEG
jgi:hypothetical protein